MITYANGQTLGMRALQVRTVNASDRGPVLIAQAGARTGLFCVLMLLTNFVHVVIYKNPTIAEKATENHQFSILLLYSLPRTHRPGVAHLGQEESDAPRQVRSHDRDQTDEGLDLTIETRR